MPPKQDGKRRALDDAELLAAAAVRSAGATVKRSKPHGSGFTAPRSSGGSAGGSRPPPPEDTPAARARRGPAATAADESPDNEDDSGEDIPPPVQAKFPTARTQNPLEGAKGGNKAREAIELKGVHWMLQAQF